MLALRDYRLFWFANFLTSLIAGITRFAFIWIALEISDNAAAPAFLGFAVGIPGLLISLPAGAISDRVDRRLMTIYVGLAAAAGLLATAAVIGADLINLPIAMVLGFGVGSAIAAIVPPLQAMIPQLVPPNRLMSAVGFQNMGQSVAQVAGAVIGGGSIAVFGLGPAFLVFTAIMLAGVALMWVVNVPAYERAERAAGGTVRSMVSDIRSGLHYAFGRDPLRSLIIVGLFMGSGSGAYGILMPDIAKNELGQGVFATSLLISMLSLGMISTSLYLASRREISRRGLMFLIAFNCFGPGLMAIGLSNSYPLTVLIMIIWGGCGGVLMTSQRTLLQEFTEPHMMGRVMALFALTFNGLLPISAIYVGLMRTQFGPGDTLAIMGGLMAIGAVLIASRSQLRNM
ncbi:MAG: MFS transporter [Chloroflexi bacterium]|nr:MFS transporter [Chloroflexota bacterium]MDA1145246.1 MFS transporter [Chloroflexota bacterium]